MTAPERIASLRRRAAEYQAAFATFSRIHEELLVMKKKAAVGAAQDKIETMMRLNREVSDVVKRILVAAEYDLEQAEAE